MLGMSVLAIGRELVDHRQHPVITVIGIIEPVKEFGGYGRHVFIELELEVDWRRSRGGSGLAAGIHVERGCMRGRRLAEFP